MLSNVYAVYLLEKSKIQHHLIFFPVRNIFYRRIGTIGFGQARSRKSEMGGAISVAEAAALGWRFRGNANCEKVRSAKCEKRG